MCIRSTAAGSAESSLISSRLGRRLCPSPPAGYASSPTVHPLAAFLPKPSPYIFILSFCSVPCLLSASPAFTPTQFPEFDTSFPELQVHWVILSKL